MKKIRLNISGMHCVSCSMMIEGELEDRGVEARCNFAGQYVDVAFEDKKITEKQIIGVITGLGYAVNQS